MAFRFDTLRGRRDNKTDPQQAALLKQVQPVYTKIASAGADIGESTVPARMYATNNSVISITCSGATSNLTLPIAANLAAITTNPFRVTIESAGAGNVVLANSASCLNFSGLANVNANTARTLTFIPVGNISSGTTWRVY